MSEQPQYTSWLRRNNRLKRKGESLFGEGSGLSSTSSAQKNSNYHETSARSPLGQRINTTSILLNIILAVATFWTTYQLNEVTREKTVVDIKLGKAELEREHLKDTLLGLNVGKEHIDIKLKKA